MNGARCLINRLKAVKDLQKNLGIDMNDKLFTTYVSMWQTKEKSGELPTPTQMRTYLMEVLIKGKKPVEIQHYTGNIEPSSDTIFVFGSNPEGRHGAGAAKIAEDKFGAVYGVGEGLTGNAYALPTKDLRVKENNSLRSIPEETIIKSIETLYKVAKENPTKQFKIAYRNKEDETTLNGYTGKEMAEMFFSAGPVPSNIIFSEEWSKFSIFQAANANEASAPTMPKLSKGIKQSDVTKLNTLFTPQQLSNRITNVATLFSNIVDKMYGKVIAELQQTIDNEPKNSFVSFQASERQKMLMDSKTGKTTFVKKFLNIEDVIKELEKTIDKKIKFLSAKKNDTNKEIINYQIEQHERMQQALSELLVQALSEIEANEGIRIILTQKKDGQLTGEVSQDETHPEDEQDEEEVAVGNLGWAFKQREADPHDSLTQNVKRVLRRIPDLSGGGKDDCGYDKYMDAEYSYATLLNGLTDMIDPDDFHALVTNEDGAIVTDANGNKSFTLPALERLIKIHPWLEPVKQELYADPDLVSEFYSAFRMDYVSYYMLSSGKFTNANDEMSVLNAIDSIIRNYEQGIKLVDTSIFDTNGNINLENAENGVTIIKNLNTDLNDAHWNESSFERLKLALNMLGIRVDLELKEFLNIEVEDSELRKIRIDSIQKILDNCKLIFTKAEEANGHFIDYFSTPYTNIARIVGAVTLFNRHMTFRQGDKEYPSYSTPNYVTTLFKKLLSSDSKRRKETFDFYKQSSWFYEGGWRNFMLEQLESNPSLVEELRSDHCLVNMNNIRKTSTNMFGMPTSELLPYSKWQPKDIKHAFVKAYFSFKKSNTSNMQYAWYNLPIFADTECAMFFKFRRFTDNYKAEILPKLRQVVLQEMGRQSLVAARKQKGAAPIANFDSNGSNFFFFDALNTRKHDVFGDEVESMIKFYESCKKEEGADIKEIDKRIKEVSTLGTALFGDICRMLEKNHRTPGLNAFIDSAIEEIMEEDFQDFYSDNITDNVELLNSLKEDGIISKEEVEKILDKDRDKEETAAEATANASNTSKEGGSSNAEYASLEEAMREYFWNNALMQSQIIEFTIIDPAFFKFDGGIDIQKRYKQVYASGRKLDTNSKHGRKFERTIYLTDRITTSRNFAAIQSLFEEAVKNKHITEKQKDEILEQFQKINNADAQAFRTPSSMRAVLDMAHEWTDQMEAAYNNIMSGKWDSTNLSVVWQTLKPFMYSVIAKDDGLGGKMLVPHQNKNSEFLMLAAYTMVSAATSGHTKMIALGKFMEEHNIDVAMYESAVKVGCQNPIDLNISIKKMNAIGEKDWEKIEKAAQKKLKDKYKAGKTVDNFVAGTNELLESKDWTQEEYNKTMDLVEPSEEEIMEALDKACRNPDGSDNLNTIHVLPYSDYMIATPTPGHWVDNKVVDGSQKRNLLPADLPDTNPDGTPFMVQVNGHWMTKEEVLNLYNDIEIENLLDSFFEVKGELDNPRSLQESLLQQIKDNPKYSRDFVNFLELKNFGGKQDFAIPLDFPTVRNKLAELILAKFKNKVTKQKARGGTCILVADTENRLNIILEDGSTLNTKDPEAVAEAMKNNFIKGFECYLPAWTKEFFQGYIKVIKNGNQEYEVLDMEKIQQECPQLLEMSGIRIPTEDKYSMTPLIVKGFLPENSGSAIMLPAEITTIVGCDFDVDKMYIRVFNHRRNEDGKLEKIEYDYSKDPKDNTRMQRENALLDIELGILRSKGVAEALLNPASFDTIKKAGYETEILSDSKLLSTWAANHSIGLDNEDALIESIHNASLKELKNFTSKFQKKRSLLSLNTYIYNHQQNMSGAALIGMYANNTTGQAKFQTTRLQISDSQSFIFGGRKIQSLHDIYTTKDGYTERISRNCAAFSAASVDNVKAPSLRKIGQTTETAYIAGFLLRAGVDAGEIALLFGQPFIKYFIDANGKAPNEKQIKTFIEKTLSKKYKVTISVDNLLEELSSHNFTERELTKNIVKNTKYFSLKGKEMEAIPEAERIETATNMARALLLFNRVNRLASNFRGSVGISRGDSPNGAAAHELHLVNEQVRNVDAYMAKASDPTFGIDYITDIVNNNVVSASDPKSVMRQKLRDRGIKIPRLQAFYSLGIELAPQVIAQYFVSQSKACQDIVTKILAETDNTLSETDKKVLYEDFVTYLLSGSTLFGDEPGGKTFEQKRNYYLYEFPFDFSKILTKNPKLASLPAIINLRVMDGRIIMEKSSKVTPKLRDSITTSFDSMLFGQDKEASNLAFHLLMYSFYKEGLIFRHDSYGTFFSAAFLSSFEDGLSVLRGTPDARKMENFFSQWIAQKANYTKLSNIVTGTVSEEAGGEQISVPSKNAPRYSSYIAGGEIGRPKTYVSYRTRDGKNNIYVLTGDTGTNFIYRRIAIIDAGPTEGNLHKFNANKTAAELGAIKVSQDAVALLNSLNAISFKQYSNLKDAQDDFNPEDMLPRTPSLNEILSKAETEIPKEIDEMTFNESPEPSAPEVSASFPQDLNNLEMSEMGTTPPNHPGFNVEGYDFDTMSYSVSYSVPEDISEMEYNEEDGQAALIEQGDKEMCKASSEKENLNKNE